MNKMEIVAQNEQLLLGSILVDPSLIEETNLRTDHFVYPEHQALFGYMRMLEKSNKEANIINLSRLGESKNLEFGGISYLQKLAESVPSVHSFHRHEQAVLDYWATREGEMYCNDFLEKSRETFNPEDLQELIQKINKLEERTVSQGKTFRELLGKRYVEHMETPKHGLSGTNTGFSSLNKLTDGWQNSELIVIGARPSMGKTAFILNSMLNACRQDDVSVTFFSIEMSEGNIIDRLIATKGGINLTKMRNPNKNFNDDDWERYHKAIGVLESIDLNIRSEKTVPEMRAIVRRNTKNAPESKHAVFIDFLTMIRSVNQHNNRHLEVEEIVSGLKQIAIDFNVPVILLAQLSRAVEQRNDKRPMMSDLRESGSIEQTADTVMFLYREEYYNPDAEGSPTELMIAKNRNGPVGKLEFKFVKESNLFAEII